MKCPKCGYTPEISQAQFNALHVWCQEVADTLNDAGLDQRAVLKPGIDIPWDKDSVKQKLYKEILKAMTGKDSTTEQDKIEPNVVAEVLSRHMSQKFGVVLPFFPSRLRKVTDSNC